MSNPLKYTPTYDFSDYQSAQPNTPLPGIQVDIQLDDIARAGSETVDALADIRRADGALVNEIVTEDSLEPGLLATLTAATRADDAEAAAVAAAASAVDAAESASELASVAATLAAGGGYVDWGDWHSAPGTTLDWGSFH